MLKTLVISVIITLEITPYVFKNALLICGLLKLLF
jgi:hypothetical protein